MANISLSSIEKIIKNNGIKNISKKAKIILRDYIEEYLDNISVKIVRIAKHDGRRTVLERDVEIIINKS